MKNKNDISWLFIELYLLKTFLFSFQCIKIWIFYISLYSWICTKKFDIILFFCARSLSYHGFLFKDLTSNIKCTFQVSNRISNKSLNFRKFQIKNGQVLFRRKEIYIDFCEMLISFNLKLHFQLIHFIFFVQHSEMHKKSVVY